MLEKEGDLVTDTSYSRKIILARKDFFSRVLNSFNTRTTRTCYKLEQKRTDL